MSDDTDSVVGADKTVRADSVTETGAGVPNEGTSRGEFLKWGTVALSGMYVGPKVTSFAVEKSLGHAGSVPTHPPTPPPPSSPPPSIPPTGGAAKLTPKQRKALRRQSF